MKHANAYINVILLAGISLFLQGCASSTISPNYATPANTKDGTVLFSLSGTGSEMKSIMRFGGLSVIYGKEGDSFFFDKMVTLKVKNPPYYQVYALELPAGQYKFYKCNYESISASGLIETAIFTALDSNEDGDRFYCPRNSVVPFTVTASHNTYIGDINYQIDQNNDVLSVAITTSDQSARDYKDVAAKWPSTAINSIRKNIASVQTK